MTSTKCRELSQDGYSESVHGVLEDRLSLTQFRTTT